MRVEKYPEGDFLYDANEEMTDITVMPRGYPYQSTAERLLPLERQIVAYCGTTKRKAAEIVRKLKQSKRGKNNRKHICPLVESFYE
ncbi:hypothetical protein [Immundisolibacter sp.]